MLTIDRWASILRLGAIICSVVLIFPSHIEARSQSPFEWLSKIVSKNISASGIKSIGVSDLTRWDGSPTSDGAYFSDLLAAYLKQSATTSKFKVLDRDLLLKTLQAAKLSTKEPVEIEQLKLLATLLNLDALLVGHLERSPSSLRICVSLFRIDGTKVMSEQVEVDRSPFFDSLSSYPTIPDTEGLPRGQSITAPTCIDCPVPQFRSRADASDRALIGLLVSSEGRVVSVNVLRGAGPEFRDEALGALRIWRLRPGHDKSGHSVPARMVVEVFFDRR